MWIDLAQLKFIDRRLRAMVIDAEYHSGMEFTITSLYRMDDPGVHGTLPLRGIDVRCLDDAVGDAVADWVNDRWAYDGSRPDLRCCIAHDTGQGFHLHFQVHPNTKRKR